VDRNTLLVGDFNTGRHYLDEKGATYVSADYMDRIEAAGFQDLWRGRNPERREFSWFSQAGNGFRLDHAFASPSLAERLIHVGYSHGERESGVSDHSALVAEFAF
jgi:exonuclease III